MIILNLSGCGESSLSTDNKFKTNETPTQVVLSAPDIQLCDSVKGEIDVFSKSFPAMITVVKTSKQCSNTLDFESYILDSAQHRTHKEQALSSFPALISVFMGSHLEIIEQAKKGYLKELDSLIGEYSPDISEKQLLKMNDKIYGVLFMANFQHLYYKESVLQELEIAVPTNYEQLIAALKKLKDAGYEYPYGASFKNGWNLANEFINLYHGYGGNFFIGNTNELNPDTTIATKALKNLKELISYTHPDALTKQDTNEVVRMYIEDETFVIINSWTSRGKAALESGDTASANPITMDATNIVASSFWADGFSITKNRSEEDIVSSFKSFVNSATSIEMVNSNLEDAAWLLPGSEYSEAGRIVSELIKSDTLSIQYYPANPAINILHNFGIAPVLKDYVLGLTDEANTIENMVSNYAAVINEE